MVRISIKPNKPGFYLIFDVTKVYQPDRLLAEFTKKHPQIFAKFKSETKNQIRNIDNEDLTNKLITKIINFLIKRLDEIAPGNEGATEYHRLAVGILELLFYPHLTSPIIEKEIHDGRKRIDITFDNAAETGFFFRLANTNQIPSQFIMVECKNYVGDINNPEIDQITGRFSPNRGKFGIILCREIKKLDRFILRCRDSYLDQRGLVIPLVDDDLINMLMQFEEKCFQICDEVLQDRFRKIALS